MSPTMRTVETLAGDTRISDKYFRWMFMELSRPSLNRYMIRDRLLILREQAIIETERDREEGREGESLEIR